MSRFIILTSYKNKYNDHINRILNESIRKIELFYLEDINNNNVLFNKDDFIYILSSNYKLIADAIFKIKDYNIINKRFFNKGLSKLDTQLLISSYIDIPKIVTKFENNILYYKENRHEGLVLKINTLDEYNNINRNIDYYLEENIDGIENKIYYVYGNVFYKYNTNYKNELDDICLKVSNSLNLDVFSMDVISTIDKHYCIDINFSPGFYLSNEARASFLKIINKK